MEKNSFLKKLTKSNLGLAKMHDTYITVPKKKVNPVVFFGNPPKDIRVKDKTSNRYFNFPFKKQANGEYRLTKFTEYLARNNLGIKFPKFKGLPKQLRGKRR
jgi:hypothetical protein